MKKIFVWIICAVLLLGMTRPALAAEEISEPALAAEEISEPVSEEEMTAEEETYYEEVSNELSKEEAESGNKSASDQEETVLEEKYAELVQCIGDNDEYDSERETDHEMIRTIEAMIDRLQEENPEKEYVPEILNEGEGILEEEGYVHSEEKFDILYQAIQSKGETDDDGYKELIWFSKTNQEMTRIKAKSSNEIEFSYASFSEDFSVFQLQSMTLYRNNLNNVEIKNSISGKSGSTTILIFGRATGNPKNYRVGQQLIYDVFYVSQSAFRTRAESLMNNTDGGKVFADAMINWEVIIQDKANISLRDIGFDRFMEGTAIEGISLDRKALNMTAGTTRTLNAVLDPLHADKSYTWKSSNTGVATVDQYGKVTAKKAGNTTISVTTNDGKKKASCNVNVLFTDVTDKSKAVYDAVYWGVGKGVVAGYGTYFDVDGSCTRAQFVLFLWRAAEKPAAKSTTLKFKDAADIEKLAPDYKKAILWGSEKGIVAGFTSGVNAGKFMPNDPCTRGQVVTFLWRYGGKKAAKSGARTFPDVPKAHKYYNSIMWASSYGITTGFSDGLFKPDQTCTRGQCVTFLYRMLK